MDDNITTMYITEYIYPDLFIKTSLQYNYNNLGTFHL